MNIQEAIEKIKEMKIGGMDSDEVKKRSSLYSLSNPRTTESCGATSGS